VAENQESRAAPERVYTVGDTIRLSISFLSEANVEEVQAFFHLEEVIKWAEDGYPEHTVVHATISFDGTVEETEVVEQRPHKLPLKRHTAVLVSLVDRDHTRGSYKLTYLRLRPAQGQAFQWIPEDPVPLSFEVAEAPGSVEGVDISLIDEPEEE
jgi:hypothetical protein